MILMDKVDSRHGRKRPPSLLVLLHLYFTKNVLDHKTALIDIHFCFKPLQKKKTHLPQLLLLNISEIYIYKKKKACK